SCPAKSAPHARTVPSACSARLWPPPVLTLGMAATADDAQAKAITTAKRMASLPAANSPTADRLSQSFDHAAHALEMRAFPIHALAARAALEPVVEVAHHRRQRIEHRLARHFFQWDVALAAARERREHALELQRAHHLAQLLLAFRGAHEVAALDFAPPQHPLVAREDGAAL